MALGIVFGLLGIGLLIAIMFNMAVFALPLFMAVIAGRFAFETTAPAAVAGYHVVLGLSRIGGAHGLWQPIFAGVGAVIIGIAALMRLASPLVPAAPARAV